MILVSCSLYGYIVEWVFISVNNDLNVSMVSLFLFYNWYVSVVLGWLASSIFVVSVLCCGIRRVTPAFRTLFLPRLRDGAWLG